MKTFRVAFTKGGRCSQEFVTAVGPCAAQIKVEKMHPGATAFYPIPVPDGVSSNKEWADTFYGT